MVETRTDVVISGAGPTGLMLACELALGGVAPIVLEALSEPSAEPKANGLGGQVVRLMDMRSLYPGEQPQPIPFWVFSGMFVEFSTVPENPMYAWPIPQHDLTCLLAERARELGVEIRWSHALTDFTQDDDGVAATVTAPTGLYRLNSRFLVGADGGKSLVRKRSGIAFPGVTSAEPIIRMGSVVIPDNLRTPDGRLQPPGFDPVEVEWNRLESGTIMVAELQPGRTRVATIEYGADPVAEDAPMAFDELRDSISRVVGAELPVRPPTGPGPHGMRRIIGQSTRIAECYRTGGVLLVGDAAHVHSSMAGPGLNLGLQDAANLGWKLAAHVQGWAPHDLLDTYDSERRPVAERVMMHTLAQSGLLAPGPEVTALRQLFGELLRIPAAADHLAHLLAGADVRYDTCSDHPLAGRFVPDFTVETGGGTARIAELLRSARPLLLDLTGSVGDAALEWSDRLDTVIATATDAPADTLLIRPDGYVAWAAAGSDRHGLRRALTGWFGRERAASRRSRVRREDSTPALLDDGGQS
ncbi:FAD-dependent monooxygenase [Nocardia transvalensis]|uniref:FAD-dependent monooxygenase n=1 Tax=Nocardia transvalensis TaxID=37333 RepID=UPI001895A699|nr:FAD-dependent monooxygenase [Nocardia transvalensis]MBF6331097.1 FAD-dependent monooxygenase [Nocardia transvalensis]